MQFKLSQSVAGRPTEYPAPVVSPMTVMSISGRVHPSTWEGLIDTGADLSVLPTQLVQDLRLANVSQKVRVWSYRKEDAPRELEVYYVKLILPSGMVLPSKAIASERKNILIGRCALLTMRMLIDWPHDEWVLDQPSVPIERV
jgi:hypothetical protein